MVPATDPLANTARTSLHPKIRCGYCGTRNHSVAGVFICGVTTGHIDSHGRSVRVQPS